MHLQYPARRHDRAYTKALPGDDEFFGAVVDLNRPGYEPLRQAVEQGDWPAAKRAYLERFAATSAGRFAFGVDEVAALAAEVRARSTPADIAALLAEAGRIAAGDIPLIDGKRVVFAGAEVNWTGWLYDSSQYQLQLTRFGYLYTLANAWALSGDDAYARSIGSLVSSCIDDCPAPIDGRFRTEHGAWEPLTVAIRLSAWPHALIMCWDSPVLSPDAKLLMIKSLYQHAEYVQAYHAEHGNHASMQLRALAQIALLFPEWRCAAGWLAYALDRLRRNVDESVYADGVQYEASPTYHVAVLQTLLQLVALFERLQIDAGTALRHRLEQMFEVLLQLRTPGGGLPTFGDTHRIPHDRQLCETISIGAALFNRPDWKFAGGTIFPAGLIWRYGPELAARYDRLDARPPAMTAALYPDSGFMVARDSWTDQARYCAMHAGVGVGGHAHADALSIVVDAFGRNLLVDPGKGLYEWTPERKYYLSTRAHNTVVVDGQDQYTRSLHWAPPPSAPCRVWDWRHTPRFDFWFASHYGYTRYDDPVIHTRKVLFVDRRYWVVIDLLHAEQRHHHELYWHLPAGDVVAGAAPGSLRTLFDDANIMLVGCSHPLVKTSLEGGLSFADAASHPAPVVRSSQECTGSAYFETLLIPYQVRQPDVNIERLPVLSAGRPLGPTEATALAITCDGVTDYVCVNHTSVAVARYLDHTGNPVADELLPNTVDSVELEFGGRSYRSDVIVTNHDFRHD